MLDDITNELQTNNLSDGDPFQIIMKVAEKVAESLDVSCNRKLVRKVLDEQRSSNLKKLKKIS